MPTGGTALRRGITPAAASQYFGALRLNGARICRRTVRILSVRVLALLPDVPVHVVQSPEIRRKEFDGGRPFIQERSWSRRAVRPTPVETVAKTVRAFRASSARVFPFRLCRKTEPVSGRGESAFVEFSDKLLAVVPIHVLHRAKVAKKRASIAVRHRFPERLRNRRFEYPKAASYRNFVLTLVLFAILLFFRTAHRKGSGRGVAKDVGRAYVLRPDRSDIHAAHLPDQESKRDRAAQIGAHEPNAP